MNNGLLYLIKKKPIIFFRDAKKHPMRFLGYFLFTLYMMSIPMFLTNFFKQYNLNNINGFLTVAIIATLYIYLPSYISTLNGKSINFDKAEINYLFSAPIDPCNIIIYGISKTTLISILFSIITFLIAYFLCNVGLIKSIIYVISAFILGEIFDINLMTFLYLTKIKKSIKNMIKYSILALLFIILALISYFFFKDGLNLISLRRVILSDVLIFIPIVGFKISLLKLILSEPNILNITFTSFYVLTIIILIIHNRKIVDYDIFFEDSIDFSNEVEKIRKNKNIKLKNSANKGSLKGRGASVLLSKILLEKRREKQKLLYYAIYFFVSILFSYFSFLKKDLEWGEMFSISLSMSIYINGFISGYSTLLSEMKTDYYYLIPISPYKKIFYLSIDDIFQILIRTLCIYMPIIVFSKFELQIILLSMAAFILVGIQAFYSSTFINKFLGVRLGAVIAFILYIIILFILAVIYVVTTTLLLDYYSIITTGILITLLNIIITMLFIFLLGKFVKTNESLK